MKLQNLLFYFLTFSIFVFSACQKEDKTTEIKVKKTVLLLSENTLEWIKPFDVEDTEFQYTNEESVETTVFVKRRFSHPAFEYDGCFDDNGQYIPCERESTSLILRSNAFTVMNLGLWVTGENRIAMGFNTNLGPSGGTIFEYNEQTGEVENFYASNFEITINQSYNFENKNYIAIIMTNISLNNIHHSGNPPKGFILVKGIGIVEWTDRAGATWRM